MILPYDLDRIDLYVLTQSQATIQYDYLNLSLTELSLRVERLASPETLGTERALHEAHLARLSAEEALGVLSPLHALAKTFSLTTFERDILLLCAAVELDGSFAPLYARAQRSDSSTFATFSLALASLENPHWDALAPSSPLRHWRLVEVGPGSALTTSPLRIDERILHYLIGSQTLDERLTSLIDSREKAPRLTMEQDAFVQDFAETLSTPSEPALHLYGTGKATKAALAQAVAAKLGIPCRMIAAISVPTAPAELQTFLRLWQRELILCPSLLLLDAEDMDEGNATAEPALACFVDGLRGALMISTVQRRNLRSANVLYFEMERASPESQRLLWKEHLGKRYRPLKLQVDRLVGQFSLSPSSIQSVCSAFAVEDLSLSKLAVEAAGADLWKLCRLQARTSLDGLAQRVETRAEMQDLILPAEQRQMLREITLQVRYRTQIYDQWGFASASSRGLGIAALFAGPSGTGKTLAAEVLANELQLDLYRIDLSSVVSKYIGETEKNLRKVFDAAEEGGTILLFDEADAIFGKRSEVKDSHDRHANIEVSYLLQRMEAYRGLAILTTNLKAALDGAFLRRIRFVVDFVFPDSTERAEIWRRAFPPDAPVDKLDYSKLARVNFTGASIRNVALQAAFLAADGNGIITMSHLLRAARSESVKLGKHLPESETMDWAT